MEVVLGPGDIVSHGDPAPPTERGTAAPTFWRMPIVAKNGCSSRQLLSCCCYNVIRFITVYLLSLSQVHFLQYQA